MSARQIGPWGTTARAVVGIGLLILASRSNADARALLLGLVVLPVASAIVLAARGLNAAPLRLESSTWHFVNCGIGCVLLTIVLVPALIFYGTSMLVAAWRGIGACEIFAISNWLRKRDDRLGCPFFLPVDALEASMAERGTAAKR